MVTLGMKRLSAPLLAGVSLVVLAQAAHAQAVPTSPQATADRSGSSAVTPTNEQETPPAPQSSSSSASDSSDIVVTGSLIKRDGYEAPTPVTVATAQALALGAPNSIQDGLNQLPQFTGSTTATSGFHATLTGNGNLLNLRSFGSIRTLILVDGNRVTPTSYLGTIDVNVLPQLLVQRVDVVTAGASAAYGADAVSGVVNYVLDTKYTGIKGTVQLGESTRRDYRNYRAGLAFGTKLGDRAHLLLSGEIYNNDGFLKSDRPEYNLGGTGVGKNIGAGPAGTAANPYLYAENVRSDVSANGGVVKSGPFTDTVFLAPNTYRAAVRGTPTGSTGFYIGPSDYFIQPDFPSLAPKYRTVTGFGRFDYELSSNVKFYVQGTYNNNWTKANGFPTALLNRTYFSGNAFLPAALQAQLTATNTPSFLMSKTMVEFGPPVAVEKIDNILGKAGLNGTVGRFAWNVGYQYGNSRTNARQSNLVEFAKWAAAIDAVRDPAGNIVCRPTLDPDPAVRARYANCVPLNMFGNGAASLAAKNYVTGTSTFLAENITQEGFANISGDLFDLWAGPISASVGANYRRQTLDLTSNADPAVPIDSTGLRGNIPASRFFLTNTPVVHGKLDVKEVYGEVAIPLIKDASFTKSLELNGAVRYTDYSTSGSATTWKLGGVWKPIEDITFRVTRSRDIRAPTLYELFSQRTVSPSGVFDPHTGITSSTTVIGGGNRNLKPEVGNTLSAGVVLRPTFLRGFDMSVDFFDVSLRDAVATASIDTILRDCEASGGTSATCGLITRALPFSDHTAANFPLSIQTVPANVAGVKTRGVDVDARYTTRVGDGSLEARLFLTYVDFMKTQLTATAPVINYAGWSEGGAGGVSGSIPRIKGLFSLNYTQGRLGVYLAERFIGKMKLGPTVIYDSPNIKPIAYTDMTLRYTIGPVSKGIDLFLTANNLFDKKPPKIPNLSQGGVPGITVQTLTGLYDIIGTNLTIGARFKF